jgi:transposase
MRQMPFSSNNHAAYGQFSKGYQKISQGVGAHDPRHFDTSRSYQKVPVCARELFLCVQKRCAACGIHKVEKCFHRSSTCWECRSRRSTSTTNITVPIDPSSFAQYFNHEPSHGSRLSLVQRSSLLTLHALGFNDERVAQLTGCDRRTVRHWVAHYQQHHSLEDEPRSGRPRVTSAATDTSIVVAATENPFTTPQNILAEQSIEASSRTVRRRLDAAGLFGRVARIEYPFTQVNITQRLEFAREHQDWTDDQWARVLFGDETYICLGANGQIWVQRPEDAAYQSEYMAQGQSNFAPKIGIWACFARQGVGALRIFDDNMDTRLYTDTMQRFMKPCALRLWPSGAWFYLQDNASYHKSHRSLEWFHINGVSLVELPPHSPDLNPIENLWADLKRRVESRHPHTIQELKEIITSEWTNTNPSTCSNLVDSMNDRMLSVIAAEGFRTGY